MNPIARCAPSVRFLLAFVAAVLVPLSAAAQQPVLYVDPTKVIVETVASSTPQTRTVKISNSGKGSIKWTINPAEVAGAWLKVLPMSGGNNVTVTLTLTTTSGGLGLAPGTYQGSFIVRAKGAGAKPPCLLSTDGAFCKVEVQLTILPTPPPPPPPPGASGVGPQSTIACPSGSVDISTGSSISFIQGQHLPGTTFCLKADGDKIHRLNNFITPRTGDTYVGEYGAVLDGTLMLNTMDDTEAAFRAYGSDSDNVTIRNLVIRNFRRGIHASPPADHWTIENNEIASNVSGLVFPSDSSVKNNYIHHNTNGGYQGAYASNSTIENNEIAYNGTEQKVMESLNVTFRNNFVHHNAGAGIWYDSNNTGVIEGNTVDDNGYSGIWHEVGGTAHIHHNTIRRNGDAGVFISTSKDTQVYNNTIENNFRAITYFVNCPSLGGGTIAGGYDLTRVSSYDNTIVVGSQSGAWASAFGYASCTGQQLAPYQNGSKNLSFYRNAYNVPLPATGQYWWWGGPPLLTWTEWQQQRGQDLSSTGSTVQ